MNKKQILAVIALAAALVLLASVYFLTRPETVAGEKSFTLIVVHKDGTEKVFELTTTQTKLGPALTAEGIIVPSDSPGMYNTVDGETSDYSKDQSYWCFYIGDEMASEGMDTTSITDGATYKLIYTVYEGP